MTALIPKGLAAAVLAALPVQRGLPGGEAVQGIVYAVIFFSIALCAVFVYVIEAGTLAGVADRWFAPFPVEPPERERSAERDDEPPSTLQGLGLPAAPHGLQEPNPITLDDEATSDPAP